MSKIEWTDATWNPVVGCSLVSPGCTNCYAMGQAHRCAAMGISRYDGLTEKVNGRAVWTGKVRAAPDDTLLKPLSWKKPRRIFVNSMSDLFHEDMSDDIIDRVFAVMALCPQHTFQILTKRPERMKEYVKAQAHGRRFVSNHVMSLVPDLGDPRRVALKSLAGTPDRACPLPNVWLGTSVEDQKRADERIPALLETPAAVRFLSCEPLLGPVDLRMLHHDGITNIDALRGLHGVAQPMSGKCASIDWVIVGGESGRGARPMHPDWARSLRDQCQAAGVAFTFKQWGEWIVLPGARADGGDFSNVAWPDGTIGPGVATQKGGVGAVLYRTTKKAAGRELDGRAHDEFPVLA